MKHRLIIALQVIVSVGLLAWIFRDGGFREGAWEALRGAAPGWIAAGFVLAGIENLLGVLRWRIFLGVLGIRIGFWRTAQIFFIGLLFNTFFIGSVGGDAVKVLILIGQGHRKSAAILSVIMDRMSGLAALVLTAALFMGLRFDWLTQSPVVAAMIHFVFAYLLVLVAGVAISFWAASRGVVSRAPSWLPMRERLLRLAGAYFEFVRAWPRTLLACGISFLMLWGYYLVYFCSARAFGVETGVAAFFAIMPAADVISALPISVGGIGVREQLFIILLGDLLGVAPEVAAPVSLVGFFNNACWGLLGALTLPFYRGLLERVREQEGPVHV